MTTLLGLSGIALAEHEEAKEDTTFSFGYDAVNQALILNSGPNNDLFECTYENGLLTTTYGEANDGIIPVDGLEDESGPKEFEPRDEHELAEDLEPAEAPYTYDGADGECGATATSVAGPNGQVNHGQFMKAFRQLIDIEGGHGCLNRLIAQSDLGKTVDGTQVKTPEADPEFTMGETGEATFVTFEADCLHGKNDPNFKNGDEAAQGHVKAEKAKADGSKVKNKGKSAQAPGKNK
jgi:hypothetical protein